MIAPSEGIGWPVVSVNIRSLVRCTIPEAKLADRIVRLAGVYVRDALELDAETSLPIVPIKGEVVSEDEGFFILLKKMSTSLILSMPLKIPFTVNVFPLRVQTNPTAELKFTSMESHETPVS